MEIRRHDPIDTRFYRVPPMQLWKGRDDRNEHTKRRWHQHIQRWNLSESNATITGDISVALLGFSCDEGVKRNHGRIGAADGPEAIRRALCNLPVFHPDISIYDAGDIHCVDGELEAAQQQLAVAVAKILHHGVFPILLGGGHEITYGHYCGISYFLKDERLSIVNFDAHFDNREVTTIGPTSGTGFWQIAQDCKKHGSSFSYLALGIQKMSNTPYLFETAHRSHTQYVLAKHFDNYHRAQLDRQIKAFTQSTDRLYITIDLDVFASPYAPGVSAPAYNGIRPDAVFFDCLEKLFKTGKPVSLDIAELNPRIDIDGRTASLSATIIFHVIAYLSEIHR